MIRLSVILPCYNVEKYIIQCLDSIYNQDIPENDYEVICVNDCSPDNTRDIIIDYQQRHSNLIHIDHVTNKKQGVARNTGLKQAKGKYVWFVDPDDYIKENILSDLLLKLATNELDILMFNSFRINENDETSKFELFSNSEITKGQDLCLSVERIWDLCWLQFKIFSRDFLIKNRIYFIEYNFFEDLDFVIRSLCKAEKVMTINNCLYYYRYNPNSTSNSFTKNMQKGYNIYMSYVTVGRRLIDLSKEINNAKLSEIISEAGIWRVNLITKGLLKITRKELEVFYNCLTESDVRNIIPYLVFINRQIVTHKSITKLIISFFIRPIFLLYKKVI